MLLHLHAVNLCRNIMAESDSSWLSIHIRDRVLAKEDNLCVKQDSGKPYFKQVFAFLQCRQPTAAACVRLRLCVWLVSLGLCGGRRFPVIPFMQPKLKPEQLIQREAHPCNPSFFCYTLFRGT